MPPASRIGLTQLIATLARLELTALNTLRNACPARSIQPRRLDRGIGLYTAQPLCPQRESDPLPSLLVSNDSEPSGACLTSPLSDSNG